MSRIVPLPASNTVVDSTVSIINADGSVGSLPAANSDGSQDIAGGNGTSIATAANPFPVAVSPFPFGATPINGASGNVVNAQAQAVLAGASGKTTYITGLTVSGGGSTAGGGVTVQIAGLLGGTIFFPIMIPTGATVPMQGLQLNFNPPLPASATNTAITPTLPAAGAGSTHAGIAATGYQL